MKMSEFRNQTDVEVFVLGQPFWLASLDRIEGVVKLVSPHVAVVEIHRHADDRLEKITVFTNLPAGRGRLTGMVRRTHGEVGVTTVGLQVTAERSDNGILTNAQLFKVRSLHLTHTER